MVKLWKHFSTRDCWIVELLKGSLSLQYDHEKVVCYVTSLPYDKGYQSESYRKFMRGCQLCDKIIYNKYSPVIQKEKSSLFFPLTAHLVRVVILKDWETKISSEQNWNCQVFFFLAFLMLFNSPLLTTWQRSEKSAFPPTSLVSLFLPFSFCHRLLSPLPAARRCSTPPVSHSHLIISLTFGRDSSAIKLRRALLLPAHSLPHCSGHTLQHSGSDWWHYLPLTDASTTFRSRLPLLPQHFLFFVTLFRQHCRVSVAVLSPVDPSLQKSFPARRVGRPEHTQLSLLADFSVWFSSLSPNTPPKARYTLKDFQGDKKKWHGSVAFSQPSDWFAIIRFHVTVKILAFLLYVFPAHNRISNPVV